MITNLHDHLKHKLNKLSLEHSDKISYFENILKSLLFLMPGRFSENELISESCMLNMIKFILSSNV